MAVKPRRHSDVRKIAFGAILAALACVMLLIGGVLELLDMTSAAAASAVVLYAVSAALTLILMPSATSTIYYVLLLGYYPILKILLEKKVRKRAFRVPLKLLIFNAGVAAIAALFVRLYGIEKVLNEFSVPGISMPVFLVAFFVLLNVFLLVYDRLLTYGAFIALRIAHGDRPSDGTKSGKGKPPQQLR